MKKTLYTCLLMLVNWNVLGQTNQHFNPTYDIRFDNISTKKNNSIDNQFQFNHIFLGVGGSISSQFDYTFQITPLNLPVGENKLSGNIMLANVSYTSRCRNLKITVGKALVNIGTYEELVSPNDIYQYSEVGQHLYMFSTGITVSYTTVNDQHLTYQVVNGVSDSLLNVPIQHNFYWRGHIGKKIKTSVSYTIEPHQHRSIGHMLNVGFEYHYSKFQFDIDYARVLNINGFLEGVQYQSIPLKLKFYAGKVRPFLKYTFNKLQSFNSEIYTDQEEVLSTVTIGIEYYPLKDKNWRFHIVGIKNNYDSLDTESMFVSHPELQIICGVKFGI